ncbi:uncharacterized protein DEA37_0002537 [Paragonimus westermani]|uniref:Uncharacterized protein n=1 Tax=Paragonimus westermani TaxID=34504 RepID=A0A5J4P273_9TREM|nr:uncharacterized protein DEA37_0002537 [Paragonimus westermani]
MVALFGASSLPSCGSPALKQAIDDPDKQDRFKTEMLQKAFYVNDCLWSASTAKDMQATALLRKLAVIRSGSRLTKLCSKVEALIAPVSLTTKRLLQELCRRRVDWEEELATEEEEWLHNLAGLIELRILGCINQMELHGFSDASEASYAAAIYARLVDGGRPIYRSWYSKSQE